MKKTSASFRRFRLGRSLGLIRNDEGSFEGPLSASGDGRGYLRQSLPEYELLGDHLVRDLSETSWDGSNVAGAEKILVDKGIVTFHASLGAELMSGAVSSVREASDSARRGEKSHNGVKIRIASASDTYKDLASARCPTFSLREGVDNGMVDIFSADQLVPNFAQSVRKLAADFQVEELLSRVTGHALRLKNFNIYLNETVTSTRGWHVDSYGGRQFKLFIYLTDVLSLADGPYCYVQDSPGNPGFEEANRFLATLTDQKPTDVLAIDQRKATALLSPAGQVIISNQSGAHRGHPQEQGAVRCLAALNFSAA